MKLIGSKMESDFREELIRSNEALQAHDSKLRIALTSQGGVVEVLYQDSAKPGNALD